MAPITILSLGGTCPFLPKAEAGTMCGNTVIPNAVVTVVLINFLRFDLFFEHKVLKFKKLKH